LAAATGVLNAATYKWRELPFSGAEQLAFDAVAREHPDFLR
jgi:hypothetical protein